MTTPNYLSINAFDAYIENNVKPALAVVGTNLKNPNKLNQVAAKMLGYNSYEAIQPRHHRERMIRAKLFVERCPFQNNRVTIKAGNILIVFDNDACKIRFRALKPGQECELVNDHNEFTAIDFTDMPLEMNLPLSEYRFSDVDKHLLDPQVDVIFHDTMGAEHAFVFKRTYEGVIMDAIYDYKASAGTMESRAVAFDDADAEDYEAVDQANASFTDPLPAIDGEHYQWLQPIMTEHGLRYMKINEEEEICLSDLYFKTPADAILALEDGQWGAYPEDVEDAVLVKTTTFLVGHGEALMNTLIKSPEIS